MRDDLIKKYVDLCFEYVKVCDKGDDVFLEDHICDQLDELWDSFTEEEREHGENVICLGGISPPQNLTS